MNAPSILDGLTRRFKAHPDAPPSLTRGRRPGAGTHGLRTWAALGALLLATLPAAAVLAPVGSPRNAAVAAGYGQCRKCDCDRFSGKGNTCRCDHSFYDHQ